MESNRTSRTRRALAAAVAGAVGLTTLSSFVASPPAGAITLSEQPYLASRSDAGAVVGGSSASEPALDSTGRFVAFATKSKLVAADTNDQIDVYLRDRWAATTELISVGTGAVLGNATSHQPSISDDGRYVAFRSAATNWGGPATSSRWNIWVRDRVAGTTVRASIGHAGDTIGADAENGSISGNGRYVTYASAAANIVPGDTNAKKDVFVRDLVAKTNDRASVSIFEGQSAEDSWAPSISDDGRYVAFLSAEELAGGRPGAGIDVFVRDRTGGSTANADLAPGALTPDGDPSGLPVLSGNGRFVAFGSKATNLVASDSNGKTDIFRHDLQTGSTVRVSVSDLGGQQLSSDSSSPAISDDGAAVAFSTAATVVAPADAGSDLDVFLRTVSANSTRRISTSLDAPDPVGTHDGAALSDDGSAVAFRSFVPSGPRLVEDQPVNTQQVYVSAKLSLGPLGTDTFIDQQYLDFLGRHATQLEKATWYQRFESGQSHPAALVAELSQNDAFAAKRAPVVRLYWAFFLRKPDPSGLSYWISKYQGGASLASIAQKFAQSSEFKNRYGALSNGAYVKQVYLNVFERQPDAGGLAYWTGKLDRKEISRGQVLVNFSESSEGKRRLAPQVHLLLISLGMLRTVPSNAFFAEGLARFAAGEKQAAWVAQQLIVSSAYDARL